MKIFFDDTRVPKGPYEKEWTIAKNVDECFELIFKNHIEEIAFDYDLNEIDENNECSKKVMKYFLDKARAGEWESVPYVIRVHSINYDGVCELSWMNAEIERLRFGHKW